MTTLQTTPNTTPSTPSTITPTPRPCETLNHETRAILKIKHIINSLQNPIISITLRTIKLITREPITPQVIYKRPGATTPGTPGTRKEATHYERKSI